MKIMKIRMNFIFRFTAWIVLLTIIFFVFGKVEKRVQKYIKEELQVPRGGAIFVSQEYWDDIANGSIEHPFKSITAAVNFISKNPGFKMIIAERGIYDEEIVLPKGLGLFGREKDVFLSDFGQKYKTLLSLEGENVVSNINIQGGKFGIHIPANAGAVFLHKVHVSEARQWGIVVDASAEKEKTDIKIANSDVFDNARQGSYFGKSVLEIKNSRFVNNGEEGIDLHAGMKTKIVDSIVSKNGEGGIETEVDNIELVVEDCSIEENGSSGINLQSAEDSNDSSTILINNNRLNNNTDFGVRCAIHHSPFLSPYFSSMAKINKHNEFFKNGKGSIDPNCDR